MTAAIINNKSITQGLELFFLGSTSLSVTLIAYTVVRILSNTQLIAESLTSVLESMEESPAKQNYLGSLFGGFPMGGTMKVSRLDKDGNIHDVGEKEFTNHEDFIKFRDELIKDAIGDKFGKKPAAEMTIEELDKERVAAEEKQDYNLAAMFRDLIEEKKNK